MIKVTAALAGNPNVGKSTVFNSLTGLNQHTGNWIGKTVACASGSFSYRDMTCSITDLPGIYSLSTNSEEEEIAREFICSGQASILIVVADATCLERGLHLLKQIAQLPLAKHTSFILCVNLCDEAAKKGIVIDFHLLEEALGIPVTPCTARKKSDVSRLKLSVYQAAEPLSGQECEGQSSPLRDFSPASLAARAVNYTRRDYRKRQDRIDQFLTGPFTGSLVMILLLLGIFWITITGANYPSAFLWEQFYRLEVWLSAQLGAAGAPQWLIGALVSGVYRSAAWVVSVMLPPMAIFFPLFTFLEDLGYLPRAAFNMDCAFKKCRACGKQCLTMAMGFGCNAVGVVGCRIIDSPRERLIAILTNSLVPCNGRFPTLIMLISLFFMGSFSQSVSAAGGGPFLSSVLTSLCLTGLILLGIGATLISSYILSRTLLKGLPSSFTLELPPFRKPQVGKAIIRSVFDRTLFVLGRALSVAAPAGLIIWLLANIQLGDSSLLAFFSQFLDPLGQLLGLDGVILAGFLLGFPANEIVIPIILMTYLNSGQLIEMSDQGQLFALLSAHGWTVKTALCMAVFTLFHWPCSTTCLTIRKETGSAFWTAAAFLIPTSIGVILCFFLNLLIPG